METQNNSQAISVKDMPTLRNGAMITLGGKSFTVKIPFAYPDQLWLIGARGGENTLEENGTEGGYSLISFKSGQPVRNKALQAIRVIVLGTIIDDVTGQKVTVKGK